MTSIPVVGQKKASAIPRAKRNVVLLATTAICLVLLAAAVLAPLIAPYNPDVVDIYAINGGPSRDHLLGTDGLGRDILSRLLYGARLSLLGPVIVTVFATALGTGLALLGAWLGGWPDRVIVRCLDVLFAFPALLFAVLAVVAFGPGLVAPACALAVAYTPYIARVVRSAAVTERHKPYIESFQTLGFPRRRSAMHLLRNVLTLVGAQSTVTFGYALLDLAAVSYIGLGVQPPTPEWGVMVSDGTSSLLNGHGQESLAAGGAIVLTVIAVNVLGERLAARSERNR